MKSFPTREGPFGRRLIYELPEIDQICEDALRSVNLLPAIPEPIRVERFLEKFFEVHVLYEEIEVGVMGCAAFDRTGRVTGFMISPEIEADGAKSSERRLRSTLAHEGGHGLLHPQLFMRDSDTGNLLGNAAAEKPRIMCRARDIGAARSKAYDGRWWEWQANRAIAGILLPKKLVAAAVASSLDKSALMPNLDESNRSQAERLVAQTFDVNPVVARIRLEEMFPIGAQITF